MPQITIGAAQSFMEAALGDIGLPASNATQVAEAILDSELRGHSDHGLYFCRDVIIGMHQSGLINPTPNVRIVKDSSLVTIVDGDKDCVVGMNAAMDASIAKAKSHGMTAGSVINSSYVVATDRPRRIRWKPDVEEIFYAGERGQKRMARLREEGIVPLGEAAWEAVLGMSEEHGVPVPELA